MENKTTKKEANLVVRLDPKKLENKEIRRIKVTLEYFLK